MGDVDQKGVRRSSRVVTVGIQIGLHPKMREIGLATARGIINISTYNYAECILYSIPSHAMSFLVPLYMCGEHEAVMFCGAARAASESA